jgi:hypothetical protein
MMDVDEHLNNKHKCSSQTEFLSTTMSSPNGKPIAGYPSSPPRIRKRRLLIFSLVFFALLFVFRSHISLPGNLKDVDLGLSKIKSMTRANVAYLAKYGKKYKAEEMHGLLYAVTKGTTPLNEGPQADLWKELPLSFYQGTAPGLDWGREARDIDNKWPLVVFSKVSLPSRFFSSPVLIPFSELLPVCAHKQIGTRKLTFFSSYSRKAKALLASYNLDPPPKIIEVDLRGA